MVKAVPHAASAQSAPPVSASPAKAAANAVTTTATKHLPSWPLTAPPKPAQNAHLAPSVANALKADVNAAKAVASVVKAAVNAASVATTTKPLAS
jgi:hypothetical protein